MDRSTAIPLVGSGTSSPRTNQDEQEKHMFVTVPAVDASLCCCHLVAPSLSPAQHLDDCVLLHIDPKSPSPRHEEASAGAVEDHGTARRRRHRESMARLRQTWRVSIAALQRQETRLRTELRHTVAHPSTANTETDSDNKHAGSLVVLRRAYSDLVQEQFRLQDEQTTLEATRDHKEKYERLLQRELERARTFCAIADTPSANKHEAC